jgi:hypothetical protein
MRSHFPTRLPIFHRNFPFSVCLCIHVFLNLLIGGFICLYPYLFISLLFISLLLFIYSFILLFIYSFFIIIHLFIYLYICNIPWSPVIILNVRWFLCFLRIGFEDWAFNVLYFESDRYLVIQHRVCFHRICQTIIQLPRIVWSSINRCHQDEWDTWPASKRYTHFGGGYVHFAQRYWHPVWVHKGSTLSCNTNEKPNRGVSVQ